MDNYLVTTASADKPDHFENCKKGQKGHRKITIRQNILPIGTLVLLIIFSIALATLPSGAMSASSERECCKGCRVQDDTQKCCKSSCNCDTNDSGSEKVQPVQCRCYKDVKCFNVCMESGYTCKHCEEACSYRK